MSGDHKTLIKGSPSQYVKLNVGGTLFYTTIGTLTKSDNMLRTMFSGRMEVLTDSEGMCITTVIIPCYRAIIKVRNAFDKTNKI